MESGISSPDAAEAFALANSMAEHGEINAAIEAYRQCLNIAPTCFPAHYNLGNALIKAGRPVDAVDAFVACLRLAPEFGVAYVNLAGHSQRWGC
jgi:tetratricopeptide (TPR) repeat protein